MTINNPELMKPELIKAFMDGEDVAESRQASDELVDRMMAISDGVFERLYWRDGQPG